MDLTKVNYKIADDIEFLVEANNMKYLDFSKETGVSRTTLSEIKNRNFARNDVLEKIYSFAYSKNFRINKVKEELIKEKYGTVLFHGSKEGLEIVSDSGSRDNCDFGRGFYLGETYNQALSFVCEKEGSSVYSFAADLTDIKIKKFSVDLEWMLVICYYRGTIKNFEDNNKIKQLIASVESSDVIIAPIADNKMFYIMSQFANGDINADVALHSLSASNLGMQYIFKTKKSLSKLKPIEKYYLCNLERDDCRKLLIERSFEIDTKLKLAKREFRNGLFIEEIFQ